SETIAEVALHESSELKPGGTAFARLRAVDPLLLLPGDRAILRQFSPVVTIGGAVVLDAFPLRRQKKEALLKFLHVLGAASGQEILAAGIVGGGAEGLSADQAVREMGGRKTTLEPLITALLQQKQIVKAGELLVAAEAFLLARAWTVAALEAFHKANPLVAGV